MFSLIAERGKYLRVRDGMTQDDIISRYDCPEVCDGKLFAGRIIKLGEKRKHVYALVGDTYKSIARREAVDEEALEKLNKSAAVYPTKRIWLP